MENGKEHEQLRLFEDPKEVGKAVLHLVEEIAPGWHNNVVQLREPVERGWDLLPPEAA